MHSGTGWALLWMETWGQAPGEKAGTRALKLLVHALETGKGDMKPVVAYLETLTGQDLGQAPAKWRTWLDELLRNQRR